MNSCCEKLNDFLDGVLTADERTLFLKASKSCPDCQTEIEENQQLYRSLKLGWSKLPIPRIDSAIVDEAEQKRTHSESKVEVARQRTNSQITSKFVTGGIVLALVVVAGVLIMNSIWDPEQNADDPGVGELVAKEEKKKQQNNSAGTNPERTNRQETSPQNTDQVSTDEAQNAKRKTNKATIRLADSHLGIRLDEPDDDFTFIQLYQSVDLSKKNQSDQKQPNL